VADEAAPPSARKAHLLSPEQEAELLSLRCTSACDALETASSLTRAHRRISQVGESYVPDLSLLVATRASGITAPTEARATRAAAAFINLPSLPPRYGSQQFAQKYQNKENIAIIIITINILVVIIDVIIT